MLEWGAENSKIQSGKQFASGDIKIGFYGQKDMPIMRNGG